MKKCRSALCWCMVLLQPKNMKRAVFFCRSALCWCMVLLHTRLEIKLDMGVAVPSVGAWFSYWSMATIKKHQNCRSALCWCMVLLQVLVTVKGGCIRRSALCWCMVLLLGALFPHKQKPPSQCPLLVHGSPTKNYPNFE